MAMQHPSPKPLLEDYPDVLTIFQLCQIFQIGRQGAYRLLQENHIKYLRVGNKYIIPKKSVLEFLSTAS